MRSVTQPPSGNLNQTVRQRTEDVSRNPVPFIASPNFHRFSVPRSFHQCRTIPNWEREKVRKTLIEYMLTRYLTDPPEMYSMRSAMPPMKTTPYFRTRRSD